MSLMMGSGSNRRCELQPQSENGTTSILPLRPSLCCCTDHTGRYVRHRRCGVSTIAILPSRTTCSTEFDFAILEKDGFLEHGWMCSVDLIHVYKSISVPREQQQKDPSHVGRRLKAGLLQDPRSLLRCRRNTPCRQVAAADHDRHRVWRVRHGALYWP